MMTGYSAVDAVDDCLNVLQLHSAALTVTMFQPVPTCNICHDCHTIQLLEKKSTANNTIGYCVSACSIPYIHSLSVTFTVPVD